MKQGLFFGGLALAATGGVAPYFLEGAPSSIQTNPILSPIVTLIINNGTWIALAGILLVLISVFL